MRRVILAVALLAGLSACKREDMYTQDRFQTWDRNSFFRNGTSMQPPVAGTVARAAATEQASAPTVISADLLARGKQRFEIFCTPCHGEAANGEGMIVQRGFTHPPSFVEGKLRMAKAEVFYNAITNGHGAMYSFADRVAPADRWAIIGYIRALQLSQNTAVAALPSTDQAALDAAK